REALFNPPLHTMIGLAFRTDQPCHTDQHYRTISQGTTDHDFGNPHTTGPTATGRLLFPGHGLPVRGDHLRRHHLRTGSDAITRRRRPLRPGLSTCTAPDRRTATQDRPA